MPTLRYPLDANGPKRLELAWEGYYRNFTVKLDDQLISQVSGPQALSAGRTLALPDGSTLLLRSSGVPLFNELRVWRNGQPLPGSAADPALRLRNTYQIILLIAGLNLVLGLLAGLLRVPVLVQLGFSWGSFILGALYLVLGLLVRQQSFVALLLTLLLYGLETAMSVAIPLLTGSGQNLVALVARLIILYFLILGLGALRQLSRAPAAPASPVPGAG